MNALDLAPPPPRVEPPARHNPLKKPTTPFPAPAKTHPQVDTAPVSHNPFDQTIIIVAKVNVGWGNTVYIRGEGGCLKWDIGTPMICSGEDRWVWCCHAEETPREFKFLRNDTDWALGENQVLTGADITVCNPEFAH